MSKRSDEKDEKSWWEMVDEFNYAIDCQDNNWLDFLQRVALIHERHAADWPMYLASRGVPASKARSPCHPIVKHLAWHRVVKGDDGARSYALRNNPVSPSYISKLTGVLDEFERYSREQNERLEEGETPFSAKDFLGWAEGEPGGVKGIYDARCERLRAARGTKRPTKKKLAATSLTVPMPKGLAADEQVSAIFTVHLVRGQSKPVHFETPDGASMTEIVGQFVAVVAQYYIETDADLAADPP